MEEACRRCGREMQQGRVYSGRWIRWIPADERPAMGYGQFGHDTLLGMRWLGLRPPAAPARRCPSCRLVEFDY